MRTLDFMVRDLNHHKLFGVAIQEMLRTVNIQCSLRTAVESVWFGDTTAGNFDRPSAPSFRPCSRRG